MRPTGTRGNHLVDRGHDHSEEYPEFGVVFRPDVEASDFRQAFKSNVTELVDFEELLSKSASHSAHSIEETHPRQELVNNTGLEDIPKRNPVQEPKHCLQRGPNQTGLLSFLQHLEAQREDFRELPTHLVFEVLGLGLSHLLRRVVKDLFRQELEDRHVVFAERDISLAVLDDLGDKGRPVVRPFLFEDLHNG